MPLSGLKPLCAPETRDVIPLPDRIAFFELNRGAPWRAQIDAALNEATVAVLLISANFLASDFIAEAELPVLLTAAEKRGLTVLPVIVGPSQFSKIPELAKFQAVNSPDRPLTSLRQSDRDEVLNDVANTIRDLMSARRG